MSQYTYRQLDPQLNEIRLLVLKPRSGRKKTESVKCDLVSVPLSMKDVVPAYRALSYSWGNPMPTDLIFIDGLRQYVAKNLNAFLRRQREDSPMKQYLWIDALCINQTDGDEKAVQIGMMRRIYTEASELLIWLDEEYGDSDTAMDLIRTFGDPEEQDIRGWAAPESQRIALRGLMERPWWKRIWIVQELALGARGSRDEAAQVICGGKRVTWKELVIAMRRLARYNGEGRQQYWAIDKALELEEFRYQDEPDGMDGRHSLLWWLVKTRNRDSTDARDKLYGIMGIVDPSDEMLSRVTVDYEESATQVFTDLAILALDSGPGLEVLRHCRKHRLPSLPSWVPDWSSTFKELPFWNSLDAQEMTELPPDDLVIHFFEHAWVAQEMRPTKAHYDAAATTSATLDIAISGTILKVKGIVWDEIAVLHEPFVNNLTEPWENATYFMMSISKCKAIQENLPKFPNPYHSAIGRTSAFWKAIMADHLGDGEYHPLWSPPLSFQQWLSPIPNHWRPEPPHISATNHGALWYIKTTSVLLRRKFHSFLVRMTEEKTGYNPSDFEVDLDETIANQGDVGTGHDDFFEGILELYPFPSLTPQDLKVVIDKYAEHDTERGLKNTAGVNFADRKTDLLEKAHLLAKSWQSGPHDLINSPFSLPSVLPDPFDQMREDPEMTAVVTSPPPGLEGAITEFGTVFKNRMVIRPGKNAIGFNGDKNCEKYALGRRFFVSKMNYMGLAPPQAEVGDVIAILYGCNVPFVLRRHGDCFKLIGETHVQGIMDGEVMEAVKASGLEAEMLSLV